MRYPLGLSNASYLYGALTDYHIQYADQSGHKRTLRL
jgi:hypothetical protein